MRHIVPLIWEAVRGDAAQGTPIDVLSYYRRLGPLRPELSYDQFRKIVLEAVNDIPGAILRLE